jgi:hypothetical protein
MAYSEGNVDKKVGKYVGYPPLLSNGDGRRLVDTHVDMWWAEGAEEAARLTHHPARKRSKAVVDFIHE